MHKNTLVVGASLNPKRYSNIAIRRLVANHIPTVAFGFKKGEVAGVTIDTFLKDYKNIDRVTLYINPARQQDYYDYILGLHPKRVIFNPGTENPEFYKVLEEHNISYEVACTLVLLSTNQY